MKKWVSKDEHNYDYVAEDGCSYQDYPEYIALELGFCGCSDTRVVNDCFQVLEDLGNRKYYTEFTIKGGEKYRELILVLLEKYGLIEHGTAIRGSWLTIKGEKVLKQLLTSLKKKGQNNVR